MYRNVAHAVALAMTLLLTAACSLALCGCRVFGFENAENGGQTAADPPSATALAKNSAALAAARPAEADLGGAPAGIVGAGPVATTAGGEDGERSTEVKTDEQENTKPTETRSEAEKVSRAARGLEEDRERLETLEKTLEAPDSDYARAEQAFNALDRQLEAARKELQQARKSGDDPAVESIAGLERQIEELEKARRIARERFDLAITDRKTLVEQITAVETRIRQAEQSLRQLTGAVEEPTRGTTGLQPTPDASASAPETASERGAKSVAEGELPGVSPSIPATQPDAAAPRPVAGPTPAEKKPQSKQVAEALKAAAEKEEVARGAERDVERITRSIDTLKKDIDAERALLESARKLVAVEQAARDNLQTELAEKRTKGASRSEITAVEAKLEETAAHLRKSRHRVEAHTARLAALEGRLARQQAEESEASKTASQRQREAWWARLKAVSLEWLLEHGPKILLILAGVAAGLFLVRFLSKRIIGIIVGTARAESRDDREDRAKTLVGVFQNAAWVVIIVWGVVSILSEVGFPVGPVLGGAAVAGLAVAFGAQRLIRDFFHGFVILLENQYGINDVVHISGIAGLVERITLRMTVLRDLEGIVHFVPNGEITTVSNLTHGWSRAVFDIGVAYKEDVDEVMETIQEIGRELRQDAKFGRLILEDLTMLGLDTMADSAVVVKFFIKTRPLKQWDVKREMLRRIKKRFDERGIEIPFPHRTVYHRHEDRQPALSDNLIRARS